MLAYDLDHGEAEQHVLLAAAREGFPIPAVIEQAPRLLPGLDLFYAAFLQLRTCAAPDLPVPWTAIREWATEHELDPAQRRAVFHHVRELDRTLMEWRRAKEKRHEQSRKVRQGHAKPRSRR